MDDIKAAFKKYDADGSGTITLDEAHLVLQVINIIQSECRSRSPGIIYGPIFTKFGE